MIQKIESELELNTSTTEPDKAAIAYLRVSTKEQIEQGKSIDVQKNYAEKYAEKHGLKIIKFIEEAKSASQVPNTDLDIANNLYEGLRNRPALQQIIHRASKNEFKHLIVATRDRLARNLELFVALNYYLKGKKINIHYAKPGEDVHSSNDSMNRFLELVLGSIAELEANLISVRVKSGMIQRVKNNLWAGGRPPYGYVIKKDAKGKKSTLIPSMAEIGNVQKVFQLFNNYGYSYRKIADEMNQINDTNYWTKGKIESIIRNETYTGFFVWGRRSRKNFSDNSNECFKTPFNEVSEIINKESTWENSIKLRHKKSKYKDAKYYSTPFLLRDKLICGHCDTKLETKNYGYDKHGNKREDVYRCSECRSTEIKVIIKKSVIENLFIKEVIQLLKVTEISEAWDRYYRQISDQKLKNKQYLKRIDNEITEYKLLQNNITTLISQEENATLKEALLFEEIHLKKEIKTLENYKQTIIESEKNYYKSSEDLKSALDKFFSIDFESLHTERKRLVIDLLVNKVIVHKQEDNFHLDICLNSPIALL